MWQHAPLVPEARQVSLLSVCAALFLHLVPGQDYIVYLVRQKESDSAWLSWSSPSQGVTQLTVILLPQPSGAEIPGLMYGSTDEHLKIPAVCTSTWKVRVESVRAAQAHLPHIIPKPQ